MLVGHLVHVQYSWMTLISNDWPIPLPDFTFHFQCYVVYNHTVQNFFQWAFLPEPSVRDMLVLPSAVHIDYRAACFCHRTLVDIGFVCSVCLSSRFLFFFLSLNGTLKWNMWEVVIWPQRMGERTSIHWIKCTVALTIHTPTQRDCSSRSFSPPQECNFLKTVPRGKNLATGPPAPPLKIPCSSVGEGYGWFRELQYTVCNIHCIIVGTASHAKLECRFTITPVLHSICESSPLNQYGAAEWPGLPDGTLGCQQELIRVKRCPG